MDFIGITAECTFHQMLYESVHHKFVQKVEFIKYICCKITSLDWSLKEMVRQ